MRNIMKKLLSQLSGVSFRVSGIVLSTFYFLLSTPVYAQDSFGTAAGSSFRDVVIAVLHFVTANVIPILTALAFITILFNILRYIGNADSDAERAKFKGYIMWSLLAFFVLLSVYGIVQVMSNTAFNGAAIVIPQFPTE